MSLPRFSQSLRVSLALIVAMFSTGIMPSAVAYAHHDPSHTGGSGEEVCPDTTFTQMSGGWVKYDGLSSTTFSVPQKEGFTVTNICYKASDEVKYPGVSTTVTSTVTNKNGQVQNLSHVSVEYTKNVTPTPAGTLNVSSACESITFSGSGVTPQGATVTFTLDGTAMAAGTHTVAAGSHTVVMFVNGTQVDSETVTVEECVETPTGSLSVSMECEKITFGANTFSPEGATVTFTLDGTAMAAGTHTVAAGSHTVVMFVNGTQVDSETVTVEACEEEEEDMISICHATGSESNPYVLIEQISVSGVFNGHLGNDHQNGEDIIPPFTFQGQTYSQNWDAEGQAIFNNKCNVPGRGGDDGDKVTLCHATGSMTNPFVKITVSAAGAFNGHLGNDHQNGEDIIPPFTFQGQTYSQNWDAEGQAIFNNDCVVPTDLCPLVPGTQTDTALCPAGRGAGVVLGVGDTTGGQGQALGAALPETLPSTGGEQNPLLIVLASLLAYGAVYFLQNRRTIGRKEALEA